MSATAAYQAQRYFVQALAAYFAGETAEAERLIACALTYTYPIGDVLAQSVN